MSFSFRQFILRDFTYYRTQFLLLFGACMLASAILGGALITGDSLRATLIHKVRMTLGRTNIVFSSEGRFFDAGLARRFADAAKAETAGILSILAFAENTPFSSEVNLYGIDSHFFSLSPSGRKLAPPSPGKIYINEAAAGKLGLKKGDHAALRVMYGTERSGELMMSGSAAKPSVMRCEVQEVISADDFGSFSMKNSQESEPSVFIGREYLGTRLGLEGKANLMISEAQPGSELKLEPLLKLSDTGLIINHGSAGNLVVKSSSYFIPETIIRAIERNSADTKMTKSMSWFVNSFDSETAKASYGFVLGTDSEGLSGNEIILNSEMASKINAEVGGKITLRYYPADYRRDPKELSASFTVKKIIKADEAEKFRILVPGIPGLTGKSDCSEWDAGIDIDFSRITEYDKDYWRKYGTTPKALISLDTASEIWRNRFGRISAVKIADCVSVMAKLNSAGFTLADAGITVDAPAGKFLADAEHGVDFSGLFIGLSFFVIAGAGLLVFVMQKLHFELRRADIGTMSACGFTSRRTAHLLLAETLSVSLAGALAGALVFGPAASVLILHALDTVWRGVSGNATIVYDLTSQSILIAVIAGFAVNAAAAFFSLKSALSGTIHEKEMFAPVKPSIKIFTIGAVIILCAKILTFSEFIFGLEKISWLFVVSGTLWLTGLLIMFHCAMFRGHGFRISGLPVSAWKNNTARAEQSTAVVAMLSVGVFMTVAVGLNRIEAGHDGIQSGTGGYSEYIETALPVTLKEALGDSGNKSILPIRKKDGSNADCLNLNRVSTPRILAFDVSKTAERKAFSFRASLDGRHAAWNMLDENPGGDGTVIPAAADADVIRWSLQKKLGDELEISGSDGRKYKLKLVAALAPSVFQGAVVISEKNYLRLFPESSGYNLFLADENTADTLKNKLEKYGVSAESCSARLQRFCDLQNSYLMIFLELGTLGLVLGSMGAACAAARNMSERTSEDMLMLALGFGRSQIERLHIYENLILLSAGVLIGAFAGAICVVPVMKDASDIFSILIKLGIIVLLVSACGTAAVKILVRQHVSRLSAGKINTNAL